ncbi:MAG TPA: hypothetical protein VJZ91_05115 [Blastocatellia bacterium]|nr:hypothetical protein [Blastocatellia bacterium]
MTYTIIIRNPIIGSEVMRVETDNEPLAMMEAESLSKRHGVASVMDGAGVEIARFRYGTAEFARG